MSCRRIDHWVLRHGTDGIPSKLRDHIDSCPRCLAMMAQIRTLDAALGETAIPDPGEAYWSGFAPRLARRLEAAPASSRSASEIRRPWAWLLAPALAAAALAFFMGREVYLDRQAPALTEKDIPVVTIAGSQASEPASKAVTTTAEGKANHQKPPAPAVKPAPSGTLAPHDNTEPAASLRDVSAPSSVAASQPSPGVPLDNRPAAQETEQNTPVVTTQSGTGENLSGSAADSKVWPDRRVTIMGEIAADTERNAREDERGLPGQGPHSLSERGYVDGAPGAETSRAFHAPERLETPQWRAVPGFPDSQSPAEAMRRLDQLAELRNQIAILQAVDPSARTSAQNRELCALWYRIGTLAVDRPLVDSALQQLSACLRTADQSDSAEWKTKTEQLTEKLSRLPN